MSDQLVLAIEPDLRQAAIVKRIVREKALADVAVVDSRDAAIEAMRTCMPDVLLLSALMSPRDEDELIAHLKTLEHAGHLQTHTIPQLASALQPGDERRGLLSAFRKKKDPGPAAGCDPDLFADEIRVFLKRAAEKKRQLLDSDHAAPDMRPSPAGANKVAAPVAGEASGPQASSWSSPFEWKPGASSSRNIPPDPSSLIANPESVIPDPASLIADPASLIADPVSPILDPVSLNSDSVSLNSDPVSLLAVPESPLPDPVPLVAVAESRIREPEPTVATAPAPEMAESPRQSVGSWRKDSGFRMKDSGSAIRDEGLVALGFAPLGPWVRGDGDGTPPANGPEDVRGLLSTLAVPSAIVSVSYPRGCRIRRVRVPAIPDPESAEADGVVIASRGAAGGHRDRHPSA